jgi:hypothetical protein
MNDEQNQTTPQEPIVADDAQTTSDQPVPATPVADTTAITDNSDAVLDQAGLDALAEAAKNNPESPAAAAPVPTAEVPVVPAPDAPIEPTDPANPTSAV